MAIALLLGGGAGTGVLSSALSKNDKVEIPAAVLADIASAKTDAAYAKDKLSSIERAIYEVQGGMKAMNDVKNGIDAAQTLQGADHETRIRKLEDRFRTR